MVQGARARAFKAAFPCALPIPAITCMVQARHLFYGIAMLDRYRSMGWKKAYLVFCLCDETFSINYSTRIPEGVNRGWFYFFVTLLNHFYWVSGATIGGVAGSLMAFNTSGLEFVMTAMFVVILLEQWLKERKHWTALIGVCAAAGCRIAFGAGSFVVPTMAAILVLLAALRRLIETEGGLLRHSPSRSGPSALCVLGTVVMRFLPFLAFGSGRQTPEFVRYLGRALPSAVFGMLVVYSLKGVSLVAGSHGARGDRHRRHGGAPPVEAADAAVHRGRYHRLHAARAVRVLRVDPCPGRLPVPWCGN